MTATRPLPPMRRAQKAEAEAVWALLAAAGQRLAAQGFMNWAQPYPLDLIRAQAAVGEVWVLEGAAGLRATLTLDFALPAEYRAEWFSEPQAPAGYLHRLAVHPGEQGRGLGHWCVQEAERLTAERGHGWLRFDAYGRNAGVQAFYRAQGYAPLREFEMAWPAAGGPNPLRFLRNGWNGAR